MVSFLTNLLALDHLLLNCVNKNSVDQPFHFLLDPTIKCLNSVASVRVNKFIQTKCWCSSETNTSRNIETYTSLTYKANKVVVIALGTNQRCWGS